jgi:hypothetical protein
VDEASSLWGRALATLTGHDRQQNQPESGQTHGVIGERQDTASAVFAHTSIEVHYILNTFYIFLMSIFFIGHNSTFSNVH